MNIFYLHDDPYIASVMHCDKHVVKMILESAQMLSTAHRILDGTMSIEVSSKGRKNKVWTLWDDRQPLLYKASHINHPSNIWVRETSGNYAWLHTLLQKLCDQYSLRYKDKIHKVESSGLLKKLYYLPFNLEAGDRAPIPQCMPDVFKVEGNSVEAYRRYYCGHKTDMKKWAYSQTPAWYNPIEETSYAQ